MAERITAINGKQIKAAVAADGLMKDVNQNLAVDVSDFAGTGLEDDGSENLRIAAAAAGAGLTGGGGSALAVGAGDGIDVATDSVAVDVTDFIDTAYGLEEDTNNIRVNIDAAYFEFSVATGEVGAISLKNGGDGLALRKSGWTPGSHNLSRFLHYSRRYWFTPKNGDSDQIYRIYKKVTPHGFFKKHRYTPLRIKNTMVWFLITSTLLRYCSMILLPMYYFFIISSIYIYIFLSVIM